MATNIKIRVPIWKTRSVGVAHYRVKDDIEIEIEYKRPNGEKLYPDKYFMKKEDALCYPMQLVKGFLLHIIPIDDFEVRKVKNET